MKNQRKAQMIATPRGIPTPRPTPRPIARNFESEEFVVPDVGTEVRLELVVVGAREFEELGRGDELMEVET
jgi:hypothetical protein